ncbi:cytochrome P450 CYP12A2-like [Vanessa atalanta]|uniref:cytochrome P450 CYP12A2-like n=1 Tax=Vanessa atalanta TaxID=42275 RepID=UPI001FCDDF73|nr:cytochrome P450 CYP12A2-like [Vanessa atalanta]
MQSFRKLAINLAVLNKQFVRPVTVSSAAVNSNENSQELKSWREIPGPSSLPLIGQIHHFLPGGSLHTVDSGVGIPEKLYQLFGPIVRLEGAFGSPTIIFLFDAEASSQILRNENWMPIRIGFQSLEYFRKKYKKSGREQNESTGLITEQLEPWKKFRSTVNPIMLQTKTIKLYRNSLNEVAEDMIKRMKFIRNEKNMLEGKFDEEMNLWALESIALVALGGRLNCLDRSLPENSPERKLIQTIHYIFKTVEAIDFKPNLWRYISTPTFKKVMNMYETQVELSKFFIGKAIKQLETKDKNLNEEKGILEKLLEIDENTAVTMASDMLFAGVDTAANTMTATLYLLATNPEKQIKLREEIMSGKEERSYLKACIKESMRILPVVSGNLRQTTKEYDILGYRIPKDMQVSFGHQFLSSMEEHFPRAKEYIPERWITEKTDPLHHSNAHPFAFSPFGFGVRSCIGRRIAELEIEIFLAKVIENFHVEWFGPPLKVKPSTLNYIMEPFNFVFKDVK